MAMKALFGASVSGFPSSLQLAPVMLPLLAVATGTLTEILSDVDPVTIATVADYLPHDAASTIYAITTVATAAVGIRDWHTMRTLMTPRSQSILPRFSWSLLKAKIHYAADLALPAILFGAWTYSDLNSGSFTLGHIGASLFAGFSAATRYLDSLENLEGAAVKRDYS